ncbi:MAG: FAD:protein FMN transferase [Bacteroidales bacterium]|nr:FAD:protein FMN transferase [Bacteroidales bacterium]
MKNRLRVLLPVITCLAFFADSCSSAPEYCTLQGYAQGGTYSVKFSMEGVEIPQNEIARAVDSILVCVDTTLSGYNKGSQLSRFNTGEEVALSDMFVDIFRMSREVWEETEGALDVAAGPLFDAWGFGFKNDSLPSVDRVAELMATCGMDKLAFDPQTRSISSCVPDVHPSLNFNAIAQGYTCDLVADYLHSLGVRNMLVDIGEIYCEGVNQAGNPWKVGVDRPTDGNMQPGADLDGIWQGNGSGCGIVTSGNYRKFYVKDGRKYSHTIDPRTGFPVGHSLLSATIVAPTAAMADACATCCMVFGLEGAKAFINSHESLEGYLIYDCEGEMEEWSSDGFNLVVKGR